MACTEPDVVAAKSPGSVLQILFLATPSPNLFHAN
jgi:hypothetical protein